MTTASDSMVTKSEARIWLGILAAILVSLMSIADDWRNNDKLERHREMTLAWITAAKVECARYGINLKDINPETIQ